MPKHFTITDFWFDGCSIRVDTFAHKISITNNVYAEMEMDISDFLTDSPRKHRIAFGCAFTGLKKNSDSDLNLALRCEDVEFFFQAVQDVINAYCTNAGQK